MLKGRWTPRSGTRGQVLAALLMGAAFVTGGPATAQAQAPSHRYTVVDLATLSQGNVSIVRGPNVTGEGVGAGTVAGKPSGARRGLLFRSGAIAEPLAGLAGGDDTTVFGLNDSGGLVGASNIGTAVRGFVGTRGGGVRELPPLSGDNASTAFALNNTRHAVGFSSGANGEKAVIWDANAAPSVLPRFEGARSSRATAISSRGDVVGVARVASGAIPVIWPSGQLARQLPLLAGHVSGEASSVNSSGDAVGFSAQSSGKRRATAWSASGEAVDIGTLPGGDFSQALDINNQGDIVGSSNSGIGLRAFLWTRGGGMVDLNTLIPASDFVLTKAVGINNAGVIMASGYALADAHAAAGHGVATASPASPDAGHGHDDTHELPVRVFLLVRAGGAP